MNLKFILIFSFSSILLMIGYFVINPSYEKSLEAKYYYEIGDYREAYTLASEAFSLDIYNRMASTIMAQSKIAMKYQRYIDDAKRYMKDINQIAQDDVIDDASRAKIKLISEIMVDSYVKLAPSVITDENLVKESNKYYKYFGNLLEKVTK